MFFLKKKNYVLIVAIIINYTKLRHGGSKFGRNFDQTSAPPVSKLRPNFDQTSTPPESKFDRSLLGISMKYVLNLIKCLPNCGTKLRPNSDQTSILGGRSLVEISTNLRHHIVQNILFFQYVIFQKCVIFNNTSKLKLIF